MTEVGIKYGVKDPFQNLDSPPTRGYVARASLGGKYNYLVSALIPPEKREIDLEDLGWQTGGAFLGLENLLEGFYVWVDPYLMIFGYSPEDLEQISSAIEWMDYTEEQLEMATCNHKYRNLIHTLFAPQEKEVHGLELEFGYRDRAEYLGYNNIPEGYWVFVYPHWFIFESDASKEETDTMNIAGAFEEETLIRASVDGRFQELIEVFYLPNIFQDQGEFKIMGKRDHAKIEEFRLPGGYWVWLAPYLFIFEKDLGP